MKTKILEKRVFYFLFVFLLFHTMVLSGEENNKTLVGDVLINHDIPLNPFFEKEELFYSVKWEKFVNAGTASLSIKRNGDRYEIKSTARSANWLKYIGIKVKDLITAECSTNFRKSYKFKAEIEEGGYKKIKIINFNHEKNKIYYKDINHPEIDFPLEPDTLDVISGLYLIRTKKFILGKSIDIKIFDDKKLYYVKTKVLKKEKIKLGKSFVDTFKTEVLLETSGIFDRKGRLFIWFSNDKWKKPVLIKSEISFGAFFAQLKNY